MLERLAINKAIHWKRTQITRLLPNPAALHEELPPVAQVTAPRPNRQTQLYSFFCDRFDPKSLELFLCHNLSAHQIARSISFDRAILAVAHDVVGALHRHEYIDPDLFDQLRSYFPKLHRQIDELAVLWPPSRHP